MKFCCKYASFEHVIKIFLEIHHSNLYNPTGICRFSSFLPIKLEEVSFSLLKAKHSPCVWAGDAISLRNLIHHWSPLSTVSLTSSLSLAQISYNINTPGPAVLKKKKKRNKIFPRPNTPPASGWPLCSPPTSNLFQEWSPSTHSYPPPIHSYKAARVVFPSYKSNIALIVLNENSLSS